MIVELRRYRVSTGQIDAMHTRMREVLLPLFRDHEIPTPFAIWAAGRTSDASVMMWMLNWQNLDHRNSTWARFRPIWEEAKKNRADEEFVTRTDLNLVEPWPGLSLHFPAGPSGCESAWTVRPAVGHGAAFRGDCLGRLFDLYRDAGAIGVTACDYLFGPLPQSLVLVSWADPTARTKGQDLITKSLSCRKEDGDWELLDRAPYLGTWQFIIR